LAGTTQLMSDGENLLMVRIYY